jgi:hypothetical protein
MDRPAPQLIPSQASASLSHMGGYGSDHVQNFEAKGIISFRSAFVEVAGSYDETSKSHTTVASAVIEGLNIMGMVTADRIVARLSSRHPKGTEIEDQKKPADQRHLDEPDISPVGSYFENLRIAGCPIDVHVATREFHNNGTYSGAKDATDLQPWLLLNQLKPVQEKHTSLISFRNGVENLLGSHGILPCSLANIDPKQCGNQHGLETFGSVILVPGFGVIHLAELLIQRHSRRLNMLRINLGSPIQGSIAAADTFSNGTTSPPTGTGNT